jgi:peroxiredoxin
LRTAVRVSFAAILLPFLVTVARPQVSGLEVMHELAPEFPPPAGPSFSEDELGGIPLAEQPAGIQRPVAIGSQADMVPPPSASRADEAPAAGDGVAWLNSLPLRMADLLGKVVMIDFWEPTCINCIRTFADNKKWWKRYRKHGFEIIGVEDPEFDISRSLEHVREAVKRFDLPYPILVDPHLLVWNLYKSNVWPNRFLIDAKGYIRYHVAGEGHDGEFERAIQVLLKEAHPDLTFPKSYQIASDENVMAPACGGTTTPEMYVGDWYGRGVLANHEGYHDGKTLAYKPPNTVEDGHFALAGRWESDRNGMIYRGKNKGDEPGNGFVIMRYHARELYAVMNVSHGHPSRLYIKQDGKYLNADDAGIDAQIDGENRSYIDVREPRMYYVAKNPEFGSHTLVLYPTRSGFTLNSFTFGNNCQAQFAHS